VAWEENGAHYAVVPDTDRLRPLALLGENGPRIPAWVLGNSTFVHDPNGTFKGLQTCRPYGDHAAGAPGLNPFAYKGYYRAPLRGLYLPFARGYHPQLKAFMSPDPLLGNLLRPRSMNRRRLFSANPMRFIDILGLQDAETETDIGAEDLEPTQVEYFEEDVIEGSIWDATDDGDIDLEGFEYEWDWDWDWESGLSPTFDVPGLDVLDLPDLQMPEFLTDLSSQLAGIGRILIDPEAYRQWRGPTRFEEIVAHPERLTRFGPQEVLGVPAGVAQSTRGARIPAYVAAFIGVAGVGAGALTLEEIALLGRGAAFGGRAAVRATTAGARATARGAAVGARAAARGAAAGARATGRGIAIGARATAQRATTVARFTGQAAKRAARIARPLGRAAALDAAKEVLNQHYKDPYAETEPGPGEVVEAAVQGIITEVLLERLGLGGLPEGVQEMIAQIIIDKLFTPLVYKVGQTAASEVEY
jgi:RHS repeat-associated protein